MQHSTHMTETEPEVVEEYPYNCQLVRERNEREEDRFHYDGPMGRVKSFYSEQKARLYADVQTLVGGFREEKTGERGAPPAVARSREDILIAYYAAQPTMGVTWVSRAFEMDEDEVRSYIEMVQNRAQEEREDHE